MPDQVLPAGIDETPRPDELPRLYVQRMAAEKAAAAARHAPGHFVLAADTVVALGRRILPKAESPDQVRACLSFLSGRRHHVLTAVVLLTAEGASSARTVDTGVVFARLARDDIEDYALSGEGIGKAGGYAIQGHAAAFVRLLSGSYTGVVGLPPARNPGPAPRPRLPPILTSVLNVEIRVACSPGELRAAAVEAGRLVDYAITRPGAPGSLRYGVGDRLRGRVTAHLPAMAGAFVALPDGADGFLPDSHGAATLGTGDPITVTVTRAAQGGKGPRLSARTAPSGPGPPEFLSRGPGAIERLQALHPGAAVFVDDPAHATPGATIVPHAWDEALETAVAALATPALDLPGGLRASIHPTPALVAIDMDAAAASNERRAKPGAQREANRAALPALAHAIRLRNLSGAILVDLAGMAAKARAALAPDLAAALAPDPL